MPRSVRLSLTVCCFVLLVIFSLVAGLRAARPGALPGVIVAGVDVGGLDGDALRAAIDGASDADKTITVRRGDAEVSATGAEVGYVLDVEATAEEALRVGRQRNPFAALRDQLRSFGSARFPVPLVEGFERETLDRWVDDAAERLRLEPVEGDLVFDGAAVARVDPAPGAAVLTEPLRRGVLAAYLADGPTSFEAATEPVAPQTTAASVDAVLAEAQQALSAPVTLVREGARVRLAPDDIGGLLEVERDGADLRLAVDPERLRPALPADVLAALDRDPVDARFVVSGGSVRIVDSVDGFRFDADILAAQLLEVATGDGPREAELAGEVLRPALSTEDARELRITEQVSTFTTEHACCQGRVTNIQLMARMIDGAVIRPGETFSVNGFIGPRTPEKGFVKGGAIQGGEFVEEHGGGVSQFATTMYNAAFFGGYAIPQSKRHSYYISRYPVGREATLNYPDVDLKVRNNSPHGILVKTSFTPTSITVSFWGTKWVQVHDITGERRNVTPPPVKVRENPGLPPGASRVVQSGREGFDIAVVRVLVFPDGREERETINTRYLPEPRIIERHPDAAAPSEEPDGQQPTSPATASPGT